MERQLSLTTRQELIRAIGRRYQTATREQKTEILNKFIEVTQYHRKHGERFVNCIWRCRPEGGRLILWCG